MGNRERMGRGMPYPMMTDPAQDCVPESPELHPPHYTHGSVEAWDLIKTLLEHLPVSAFEGGLIFNVLKYLIRYPHKGTPVRDLVKMCNYADKLRATVQGMIDDGRWTTTTVGDAKDLPEGNRPPLKPSK